VIKSGFPPVGSDDLVLRRDALQQANEQRRVRPIVFGTNIPRAFIFRRQKLSVHRVTMGYRAWVKSRPLVSQSIMTGCLFFMGDAIAQKIIENRVAFNWKRAARITVFGTIVAGPLLSLWYTRLNAWTTSGAFANVSPLKVTLLRTALDQFAFTPVFLTTFFTVNGLLDGKTTQQIQEKLKMDFAHTLAANWKVWIPVQLLNFRFIPADLRLLFTNSVATLWNSYLSYKNQA